MSGYWDDCDDCADDEWVFCPCGVTLDGYSDESDGLCAACTAQPHPGRDSDGYPSCRCDECEAYWDRLAAPADLDSGDGVAPRKEHPAPVKQRKPRT